MSEIHHESKSDMGQKLCTTYSIKIMYISIFRKRKTRIQLWNLSCDVCREESGPWILVESLGGAQLWWSEHC